MDIVYHKFLNQISSFFQEKIVEKSKDSTVLPSQDCLTAHRPLQRNEISIFVH